VSSSNVVLDSSGPSAYSHASSLGCVSQGPQIGFSPSHLFKACLITEGTRKKERTIFKNLYNKSEKYSGNDKQRVDAHLQLKHAFPCLRPVKALLGPDLDPLSMLVDI
jgi:hypothetical protein